MKLVSICLVTYNSSQFVIDALESIKKQTYPNIELIVSDDCSEDETIKIVKAWIEKNSTRFFNVCLHTNNKNLGITKNLNVSFKLAKGEYLKPLGGDDMLVKDCIKKMVDFLEKKKLEFGYSKVIPFTSDHDLIYERKLKEQEVIKYRVFDLDIENQYRELLKDYCINTGGFFLKKSFINRVGLFDETYQMMEDYPFVLKAIKNGYKLNLCSEYLFMYRVRTINEQKEFFQTQRNIKHINDLEKLQKNIIIPEMKKRKMYLDLYNLKIKTIEKKIITSSNNKYKKMFGKMFGYLSLHKLKNKLTILSKKSLNIHKSI